MTDNIQRKIAALLERAAHPATPEAERAACQEKADAMMTLHKIERATFSWEKPIEERRKPVTHYLGGIQLVDSSSLASRRDDVEYEIEWEVNEIMRSCFLFAGAKARTKYFMESERPEGASRGSNLVIVGYEEDIFYGQLVWNMAFQEIVKALFPGWSDGLSMDANVFNLKEAGRSWSSIRETGIANGAKDSRGPLTRENAGSKLRTAYKREAKRRGLPPELPKLKDPQHWRKSFIAGFRSSLGQRMTAAKAGREEYFIGKNLPAIQQDEDAVKDLYEEHFPPPPPMTPEQIDRAKKWTEEQKKKKPRKAVKVRQGRYADANAWSVGVSASNRVDLGNTAQVQNKKELQ
jgi:hypothetical protein